jgi:hypothetical protein
MVMLWYWYPFSTHYSTGGVESQGGEERRMIIKGATT